MNAGCWDSNLGLLQEQQVLLAAESPLWPFLGISDGRKMTYQLAQLQGLNWIICLGAWPRMWQFNWMVMGMVGVLEVLS